MLRPARAALPRGGIGASIRSRLPILVAVASLLLWFGLYSQVQPDTFIDESSHFGAIQNITRGDYSLHPELPMLPGYHWIAAGANLFEEPTLARARFVTLCFAVGMVVVYASARRRLTGSCADAGLLRFAWLPILFPYTAMAYTDVPAVFFFVGALWAKTRRSYLESAAWLLGAGLIRQTTVIWAGFFVAWIALELWTELRRELPPGRSLLPESYGRLLLPRVAGYLAVLGIFTLAFLVAGRVQATPVAGQDVRANIDHLYAVSFLILLLWAPIWVTRMRGDIRWLWSIARWHPGRALVGAVLLAVAGLLLVATYTIPHPGNQFSGFFLRNEPLLWMDRHLGLRVLGVLLAPIAIVLTARLVWSQPQRGPLALAGLFSVGFILPHAFVEPRYYIIPFVLFGFLLVLRDEVERRMAAWSGLLCALMAFAIARDWLW